LESAYIASGFAGVFILLPLVLVMARKHLPSMSILMGTGRAVAGAAVPTGNIFTRYKADQEKKAKKARANYETVIVYDITGEIDENKNITNQVETIWRASLPASVLQQNLDERSRWTSASYVHYFISIGAGFIGISLLSWWVWSSLIPPEAWLLKGVFSVFGAIVVGLPLGVAFAPVIAPRPFWVMNRTRVRLKDGTYQGVSESYIHTKYKEAEWVTVEATDPKTQETVSVQRPRVHRSTDWYEITQARDETEFHKSEKTPGEKWDTAFMALAALGAMGLLFLFATANNGGT